MEGAAAAPAEYALVIRNPARQLGGGAEGGAGGATDFHVAAARSWTVARLKEHLQQHYAGNPEPRAQRLIYAGQLLRDTARLDEVLKANEAWEVQETHTFHLVVAGETPPASPAQAPARQAAPATPPAPLAPVPAPAPVETHAPATPTTPQAMQPPGNPMGQPLSPAQTLWSPQMAHVYAAAYTAALAALNGNAPGTGFVAPLSPEAAAAAAAVQNPFLAVPGLVPGGVPLMPMQGQAFGAPFGGAAHAPHPPLAAAQRAAGVDAAAAGQARRAPHVRVIRIDVTLIVKLVFAVLVLNQDGSRGRLFVFIIGAVLVYLYQTGVFEPFMRRIQRQQRARVEGQQQLAQAAAAQAAPGGGAAPQAPNNQPLTLMQEARLLVVGFFSSLLPGWQPPEFAAPPPPQPQPPIAAAGVPREHQD